MMSIHDAQCTHDGQDFFGIFEVLGRGADERISVRYNGDQLEALTGGLAAGTVARTLLKELVLRKEIADKVRRKTMRAAGTG
jgi:hypothetical protein